jgi:penicillin-binding protein 1C
VTRPLRRRQAATLLLTASLVLLPGAAQALPSPAEVRARTTPSDAWLLDRHGQPLQRLRLNPQARRLPWTPLKDISPMLQRMVMRAEDRRFLEHAGIDWSAAGKAAWDTLSGNRQRGASTLSMQLVGLIDADYRRRGQRSVLEKINQSLAALRLERQWSKAQILEAYLNLAGFHGEQQGVAAMSRHLFGKWPAGLDAREAAIAAVLLRAPNAPPAWVARRACALLTDAGQASECNGLESFVPFALSGAQAASFDAANATANAAAAPERAPHLARKLLTQPGQRLRSSLDGRLQDFATAALRRNLADLAQRHAEDGAVLVLDNASGAVLAWVGSSGDLSEAAAVDGVVALRQAGSTLKPLLYALAFERRELTPASLIEDAPLTLATGNGLYAPQNYEPDYHGWVSARMALGGSLNVPAVKTLVRIGPDRFGQRLRQSGLSSLRPDGEWYGYSLALGSADVSLLMLANAYRMLANGGLWSALHLTHPATPGPPACQAAGCVGVFSGPPRQVYGAASSFLISDILADRAARATTFGLESWLATPYWAAAKTGTSKDMRDNWCIGYSRQYTVAVWIGNASGAPMHDVSGISGAAPVWREVMDWLHRGDPARARPAVISRPPPPPAGVVSRAIQFEPALEPARQEYFITGTETSRVRQATTRALAHISYPSSGTIIALDPDIPPTHQRLSLALSAPPGPGWRWRMDDQLLGPAQSSSPRTWPPRPGTHQLTLEDARGQKIDSVRFEVRALRGRRQASPSAASR